MYDDFSIFEENLVAALEAGAAYITLHPRTKIDGYGPPARWDLIARAKDLLTIPLVGNGDILNVQNALDMLAQTKCDALMIGRGSVINPFIFHEIRSHFSGKPYTPQWESLHIFLQEFTKSTQSGLTERNKINKLKQLMSFLFKRTPELLEKRDLILTSQHTSSESFMDFAIPILQRHF